VPLTRVDQVAPGADCPEGGRAIRSGTDDDGDGVLDDAEIDSSDYVCTPATPHPDVLDDSRPEPAGASCARGGTAVRSGTDLDDDGILDDGEVERTIYVCNDGTAPATLVSVTEEPAGAHCLGGGAAIAKGADLDGDGVLDASEVTSRTYACDTALVGDYRIDGEDALAALAGIRVITGTLTIDAPALTSVALPELEYLGGGLDASNVAALTTLDLPALRHVGGKLELRAGALASLDLSSLASVAGALAIVAPALPALRLDALDSVGGRVDLEVLASELAFPELREVADTLVILRPVESLSFPRLESAGGLALLQPASLRRVDAPSLRQVSGRIDLGAFVGESLSFPSLEVAGEIFIAHSDTLVQLSLPALHTVTALLTIGDATQLVRLDLPVLGSAENLTLRELPRLTSVELPALRSVTDELNLWFLTRVQTLSAPQLSEVGSLSISGDDALTNLDGLGRLAHVRFRLGIVGNPGLRDLSGLHFLSRVDGTVDITENAALELLRLPLLQHVSFLAIGRDFGNPALTTLDLPLLIQAEALGIYSNPLLSELRIPQLRHVTDTFWVTSNPHLSHCQPAALLAQLNGAPDLVFFDGNDDTGTCAAP
jgi:hypothetical protein